MNTKVRVSALAWTILLSSASAADWPQWQGGALVCLDFQTGKIVWNEHDDPDRRVPKGSVALADGRLYYRTETGTLLLIEPSPKQYLERGRFEQPDRTKLPAWAHPVVANGKLYVRNQDLLLCYDVKAHGT